jgi:hypothetical protein
MAFAISERFGRSAGAHRLTCACSGILLRDGVWRECGKRDCRRNSRAFY